MGQTCSAGLALWDCVETIDDLLRRADEALYLAKDSGRDQLAQAQSRQAEPVMIRGWAAKSTTAPCASAPLAATPS